MIKELRQHIEEIANEPTVLGGEDDSVEAITKIRQLANTLWTHALGGITYVQDQKLKRKVPKYVPPQKWAAELLLEFMKVVDGNEKGSQGRLEDGQVRDLTAHMNDLANSKAEPE